MKIKFGLLAGLATLLVANAGCSTIDVNLPWEKSVPTASAKHPVIEVMALWQPGEGRGLDHLPTRGFAGQILFFSAGIETPVKVDGDITIYLFDDAGSREEQKKPIHEFTFDAGSWNSYFRETNFGPAYQVFIPYTRRGSQHANCALRIKFQPKTGAKIFSDVANIVLKGEKKEDTKNIAEHEKRAVEDAIRYTEKTSNNEKPKTDDPAENRFEKLNDILKEAQSPKQSNRLSQLEKLLENAETSSRPNRSEIRQPRMLPNRPMSRNNPHILDSGTRLKEDLGGHPLEMESF